MANKDQAETAGYRRGLKGKLGAAGVLEGWGDDRRASQARIRGFERGQRDAARIEAQRKARRER